MPMKSLFPNVLFPDELPQNGIFPDDIFPDLKGIDWDAIEKTGDCANIERKVNPDSWRWKTVNTRKGWSIQKDRFSELTRIVDNKGYRKGNGSLTAMQEKMDRLLSRDFLRVGDIIGVSHIAYEHYGIYAGKGKVIHYAGDDSDFDARIYIHEASLAEFLHGSRDYFVTSFSGKYPVKIQHSTKFFTGGLYNNSEIKCDKMYSDKETQQ